MENLNVEMKIVDCQCACGHCCLYGNKGDFVMPIESIDNVLSEMEKCKPNNMHFFPLDDISNYPDFFRIFELDKKYNIKRKTFSTNGTSVFDSKIIKELNSYGIEELQLAFHGFEDSHDKYVSFDGAFESLVTTIRQALKENMGLWIVYFIRKDNIKESKQLYKLLLDLGVRKEDIGIFQSQYIGRSARGDSSRFTNKEELYRSIDDYEFHFKKYYTEAEWLNKVKDEEEWDRPAFVPDFQNIELIIDKNLDVYHKKYNPYYLYELNIDKAGIRLGNLEHESLKVVIDRYEKKRPRLLEALEGINISELANIVGQKSQIVYTNNDPVEYKWQYEYLKTLLRIEEGK